MGTEAGAWVQSTQLRPRAGLHRVSKRAGAGAQQDQGRLSLRLLLLASHVCLEQVICHLNQ